MNKREGSSGAGRLFKIVVGVGALVAAISLMIFNLGPHEHLVSVRSDVQNPSDTTLVEPATSSGATVSHAVLVNASSGLEDLQTDHTTPLVKPGSIFGYSYPEAVYAPDGKSLYYNSLSAARSFDGTKSPSAQGLVVGDVIGRPSIRMLDLQTGADTLYADGASTVAVNSSGAVAYVRETNADYRYGTPSLGDVVVQRSPDSKPEVWSAEPGQYEVVAWGADDRLFVDHQVPDGTEAGVQLLYDAPGSSRVLKGGVVALSGDGTTALMNALSQRRRKQPTPGDECGDWASRPDRLSTWRRSTPSVVPPGWAIRSSFGAQLQIRPHYSCSRRAASDGATSLALKSAVPLQGVTVPQDAWMAGDGQTLIAIANPPVHTTMGQAPDVHSRLLVQCDSAEPACSYNPLPDHTDSQTGRAHNPSRPLAASDAEVPLSVEAR